MPAYPITNLHQATQPPKPSTTRGSTQANTTPLVQHFSLPTPSRAAPQPLTQQRRGVSVGQSPLFAASGAGHHSIGQSMMEAFPSL